MHPNEEPRKAPQGRQAPAQERARSYLLAALRQHHKPGDRLPPIRELARHAGTACAPMHKAVRVLVDEGVLSAKPGVGIRVVHEPLPGQTASTAAHECGPGGGSPRERVRERVRGDILGGHFALGTVLPAAKELSRRYGVCTATMRGLLNRLVSEGLLEPFGRGFRTHGPSRHPQRDLVVLLAPSGGTSASTAIHDTARSLRLEATAAGVELLVAPLEPIDTPQSTLHRLASRIGMGANRSRLLGIVAWFSYRRELYLATLMPYLLSLGVPIAVADDDGSTPQPAFMRDSRVALFSAGYTQRCGRIVGSYLLDAGHRRVIYLTPTPRSLFSINRQGGLSEVMSAAGGSVTTMELPGGTASENFPWKQTWPILLGVLDAKPVQSYFTKNELTAFEESLRRTLYSHVTSHALAAKVKPLFGRALADPDATAWVAANDETARICLRFLAQQGIPVPANLCVVGFDDSPQAAENDLTSYNFNGPGISRAMLQFVLHPRRASRRTFTGSSVDIDGFVVERGSAPSRFCPRTA